MSNPNINYSEISTIVATRLNDENFAIYEPSTIELFFKNVILDINFQDPATNYNSSSLPGTYQKLLLMGSVCYCLHKQMIEEKCGEATVSDGGLQYQPAQLSSTLQTIAQTACQEYHKALEKKQVVEEGMLGKLTPMLIMDMPFDTGIPRASRMDYSTWFENFWRRIANV